MAKFVLAVLMGGLCCAAALAAPQAGARGSRRAAAGKPAAERVRPTADRGPRMTGRERRLLEMIEESESLQDLVRAIPEVRVSPNVELRQAMVDALEEKGKRALDHLALFIADPDEDVAEAAFTAWTTLLNEAKAGRRVAAIVSAARVLQPAAAVPAQPVVVPAQPVVAPAQQVVVPAQQVVVPAQQVVQPTPVVTP